MLLSEATYPGLFLRDVSWNTLSSCLCVRAREHVCVRAYYARVVVTNCCTLFAGVIDKAVYYLKTNPCEGLDHTQLLSLSFRGALTMNLIDRQVECLRLSPLILSLADDFAICLFSPSFSGFFHE